jgi:exopolysaccharide production negative regulator
MRISKITALLALIGIAVSGAVSATPRFESPDAALKQGLSAFRGGYYEIAEPALQYAARSESLLAKYYLAMIYSDNLGARTDHVKAYGLFRDIVDVNADIDPDIDPRAPIVGRSMTALAKYVKSGLPELHMRANPRRAADLFQNASLTFNDADAQYELAKLLLEGEGVKRDPRTAIHWLSVLSQSGHASAQAFLSDLLWRGKYVKADPVRALALIAVSVENAPPQERLWIEDIYQSIYCGTAKGIHKQATGVVAEWGERYGQKNRRAASDAPLSGAQDVSPVRTCDNGHYVGRLTGSEDEGSATLNDGEADIELNAAPSTPTRSGGYAYGSTSGAPQPATGFGLRGVSTPAR